MYHITIDYIPTWVLNVFTQIKLKYITSHHCLILYIICNKIITVITNNQSKKLCYGYLYDKLNLIPILQPIPTTTTTRSVLKSCTCNGHFHSWPLLTTLNYNLHIFYMPSLYVLIDTYRYLLPMTTWMICTAAPHNFTYFSYIKL